MDEFKTTDWVYCPFDSNHRMRYSKFHNHFVKCQKNHPDDPRIQCPYYASELVHPDEMKDHLLVCQYKRLYPSAYLSRSNVDLPVYDAPCHIDFDEESSDEDDSLTSFSHSRTIESSLFSSVTSIKNSANLGRPNAENFDASEPSEVDKTDLECTIKNNVKKVKVFENDETSEYIDNTSISTSSEKHNLPLPSASSRPKLGFGRAMLMKQLLEMQTDEKKGFGSGRIYA